MKTIHFNWHWTERQLGVILAVLLGLLPTFAYATLWYHIPKTLGPVLLFLLVGAPIWVVAQLIWGPMAFGWGVAECNRLEREEELRRISGLSSVR